MKSFILFLALALSAQAQAFDASCVFEGEEYIQDLMNEQDGITWMEVVYNLHADEESVLANEANLEDFEGLGSCRFMMRDLGATPAEVVKNYPTNSYYIGASRAYLAYEDVNPKIVIPAVSYNPFTQWITVQKGFFVTAKPYCEQQMKKAVDVGQISPGINFKDIEFKVNTYGGVSAIINGNTPTSNLMGICHFHGI